jgi:hypothetical protein
MMERWNYPRARYKRRNKIFNPIAKALQALMAEKQAEAVAVINNHPEENL